MGSSLRAALHGLRKDIYEFLPGRLRTWQIAHVMFRFNLNMTFLHYRGLSHIYLSVFKIVTLMIFESHHAYFQKVDRVALHQNYDSNFVDIIM